MNPPFTILVATDFSPAADAALHFALDLGARLSARYLLLHVVPVDDSDSSLPLPGPNGPGDQGSGLREDAAAGLERRIARLRADHPGLEINRRMRSGVPFREICRCAGEEAVDLIVVATRGRGGVAHLLIGNTAEQVVRHAHCPVITVRAPDPMKKLLDNA